MDSSAPLPAGGTPHTHTHTHWPMRSFRGPCHGRWHRGGSGLGSLLPLGAVMKRLHSFPFFPFLSPLAIGFVFPFLSPFLSFFAHSPSHHRMPFLPSIVSTHLTAQSLSIPSFRVNGLVSLWLASHFSSRSNQFRTSSPHWYVTRMHTT